MSSHSVTNELLAKINDLRFLEDELEAAKTELRQAKETIRDLDRDNVRLGESLEKTLDERDKLRAYAVNLTTRLSVVSENVASIIREAGRSALAEGGRLKEQRQEQQRIESQPPTHRQAVESTRRRFAPIDRNTPALEPEPEPQAPEDYAPPPVLNRMSTRPPTNEYR